KRPPKKCRPPKKTNPPRKDPTIPRIISVMQPKPRPREIFPASHPAIKPMTIQPQNPLGSAIQKPFVSNEALNSMGDIQPPRKFSCETRSFFTGLVRNRSLADVKAGFLCEIWGGKGRGGSRLHGGEARRD